jgi:hypothetical protein
MHPYVERDSNWRPQCSSAEDISCHRLRGHCDKPREGCVHNAASTHKLTRSLWLAAFCSGPKRTIHKWDRTTKYGIKWFPICLHSCIYLWLHSPFLGPWPLFQFLTASYTVGRTPWMGDKPVARPLPTHKTTQIQSKHIYLCLEWDSNPRSQCSSERR